MLKKFNDFINEGVRLGDFINDYSMMIIDVFDPEPNSEYKEYMAYGVDSKKFYLLYPDFEVIGEYDTLEELEEENGISTEVNINALIDKL